MRFDELVGLESRPAEAVPADRIPVDTDTYANQLTDDPRNNGFVSGLLDRRRAKRFSTSRRGFMRGTVAVAATTAAVSTLNLFGPARRVEAQGGVVGTYPRRILQFCPPYNSGDNCQPGCGSSPICTDCCGSDGFFRNDPGNGYSLYAGGCGDGDIADGWLWRFSGKCGNCAEIEYRCSDGYVNTDNGPAPFICRTVTECVPLAEGEAPGEALPDAARDTNWRPAGALEVAIDNVGSVTLNGWISDGSGVPIQMRIRANNNIVHFGTAALPRPDIASTRRGAGTNVGFAVSFPIEPGEYQFCVDALSGVLNATVGCITMNVGSGGSARGSGQTGSISQPPPASSPETEETGPEPTPGPTPTPSPTATPIPTPGPIEMPTEGPASATTAYGSAQVIRRSGETTGFASGWAGDADTNDPVVVDVHVDGESAALTSTYLPRPDVASAFDTLGNDSGYAVSFAVPEGPSEICVYAVSPDDGRRVLLGCRQFGSIEDTPAEQPPERPTASGSTRTNAAVVYGAIDNIDITTTGVTIKGWSFDPNDRDRTISLSATASGQTATAETGEQNVAAQRIFGVDAQCGFTLELALESGNHELTVNATSSDGSTTVIGQQAVVIP